jgi:hypothetical protein
MLCSSFVEHLTKRISTIQLYSLQILNVALPAFAFSISQETKNSSFRCFFSYLTLPPTWIASLVFDAGSVFVIHIIHFQLSFTAFYFKAQPSTCTCTVLLNKYAFLFLASCSTLNPHQSHLFLMFTSFHTLVFHLTFSSEGIAIAI